MGEVVSLSRARKQRERAADKAAARANRVAHGRSKAEKAAARLEAERRERALDGSRRAGDDHPDD